MAALHRNAKFVVPELRNLLTHSRQKCSQKKYIGKIHCQPIVFTPGGVALHQWSVTWHGPCLSTLTTMKAITTTIPDIPSNAVKLPVTFTYNTFSVPINFGRSFFGDAKGTQLWRHPFTIRAAIRTPRDPAHNSRPRIQTYNQQKQNEN